MGALSGRLPVQWAVAALWQCPLTVSGLRAPVTTLLYCARNVAGAGILEEVLQQQKLLSDRVAAELHAVSKT